MLKFYSRIAYCHCTRENKAETLDLVSFAGLERQLGGEAHDGTVRGGEYYLRVPIGRLQSRPRVYRRLHLLVDALQGSESDVERGNVPQTNWWMGLIARTTSVYKGVL